MLLHSSDFLGCIGEVVSDVVFRMIEFQCGYFGAQTEQGLAQDWVQFNELWKFQKLIKNKFKFFHK